MPRPPVAGARGARPARSVTLPSARDRTQHGELRPGTPPSADREGLEYFSRRRLLSAAALGAGAALLAGCGISSAPQPQALVAPTLTATPSIWATIQAKGTYQDLTAVEKFVLWQSAGTDPQGTSLTGHLGELYDELRTKLSTSGAKFSAVTNPKGHAAQPGEILALPRLRYPPQGMTTRTDLAVIDFGEITTANVIGGTVDLLLGVTDKSGRRWGVIAWTFKVFAAAQITGSTDPANLYFTPTHQGDIVAVALAQLTKDASTTLAHDGSWVQNTRDVAALLAFLKHPTQSARPDFVFNGATPPALPASGQIGPWILQAVFAPVS